MNGNACGSRSSSGTTATSDMRPATAFSAIDIDQAVANATVMRRNKRGRAGDIRIDSTTDGGRSVVVIGAYDPARSSLRPITAWEAE